MTAEYALLRALVDDDLGPLARDWVGSTLSWQGLIGLLAEPNDAFWDDITTPGREDAHATISAALDTAASELRGALGSPGGWTWGRLHTAMFREDTVGSSGIAPLEWYFNSGPFPVAGAAGAVNASYYQFRRAYPDPTDPDYRPAGLVKSFEVTNLPSYREVFDMGALDAGQIIQTTGNSGNPFDRHYGDLIDDYLAGKLVPLPFSEAAVQASAVSTLVLLP
jgi:penicillin amidase